jgi:hypothetical protein
MMRSHGGRLRPSAAEDRDEDEPSPPIAWLRRHDHYDDTIPAAIR